MSQGPRKNQRGEIQWNLKKLSSKNPFWELFSIDYLTARDSTRWILDNLFNIKVRGVDNIPPETSGGGVFISNHTDNLDVLLMGCYSPRQVTFLGKAEIFNRYGVVESEIEEIAPWWEGPTREAADSLLRIFSSYVRTQALELGGQPIIRGLAGGVSKREALEYLHKIEDQLVGLAKEGKLLGIYPEGTRSKDGMLGDFKPMAARVAIQAGVPIIPSAMVGSHGFSTPESLLSLRSMFMPVEFHIGEPLNPPEYNSKTLKQDARDLTETMRQRVLELIRE